MPRSPRSALYTALQLMVGAGVAAAAVWLGVNLYQRYAAQKAYDEIADAYLAPVESSVGAIVSPEPETFPVDWEALTADYPEAVGWLQMDDLPTVNYPVMHHADNDYYLHRAPDGSASPGGSLFMDSANASPEDAHVLLYGHAMQDESMFGTLYHYRDEDFYCSGSGCFTLYTAAGAQRYRIFAVQVVADDAEVYTVGFAHDEAFDSFLQQLKAGSLYDTGVEVSAQDRVVTLSTCATTSGQGRLVVSAKAVEE